MKRKSIAFLGLASPLLIGICIFAFVVMSLSSWLLFSSGGESPITKIATVGPFFTAKILPGRTDGDETGPVDEAAPVQANALLESDTGSASSAPVAEVASLTSEEIEAQLGFALPENTVNSITRAGLGTRLVIPSMNLDSQIVLAPIENQTWKVEHLDQSIGHLEGTAPPGSDSNIVLAAHVTLEGGVYGPFAGIGKLNPGESVFVYDNNQQYEYVIDGLKTVERTAVEVTYPTDTGKITLITCNTWDEAQGIYTERLVVQGHLVSN